MPIALAGQCPPGRSALLRDLAPAARRAKIADCLRATHARGYRYGMVRENVNVTVSSTAVPSAVRTVIIVLYAPTLVGMPLTTPVAALMVRPGGKLTASQVWELAPSA